MRRSSLDERVATAFLGPDGSQQVDTARLASAARFAVTLFGGAIGLRQMGLANDIIALAFGLTLGAVAAAGALAFGLGAREQAGDIVRGWRSRMPERQASGSAPVPPVPREHGRGAVA